MKKKFYEENLKEFVEKEIMPILNEKETELETKQTEIETLLQSEQSELDTVSQQTSQEIQRNTIKLA